MGRRIAIAILVISTFLTALVSVAFARPVPISLDTVLGASTQESVELPPSMGGGRRKSYQLAGSFSLTVNSMRVKLLPQGWRELSVSRTPGHSLFTRGIDEIQVFEGRASSAHAPEIRNVTRLGARDLHWEPNPDWVTVVIDQPSKRPVDRARGILHDFRKADNG